MYDASYTPQYYFDVWYSSEVSQQPALLLVGRSNSTGTALSSNLKQQHKPSPLSIPSNNVVAVATVAHPHILSQHQLSPQLSPLNHDPAFVSSVDSPSMSLTSPRSGPSPSDEDLFRSSVHSHRSPRSSPVSPPSPLKIHPTRSVLRHSRSSTLSSRQSTGRDRSPSRSSLQGRKSGETDVPQQNDITSVPNAMSLRSKLSLPALKIKGGERLIQSGEGSPTLSVTPSESLVEQPRVQIKDVDFELVNPSVQQMMLVEGDPSTSPLPSPAHLDGVSSFRSPSPVLSILSGVSTRVLPSIQAVIPQQPSSPPMTSLELQDVEAHRQRELRWITAMASIAPSHARKSKKIRKLLYEGVPASVRYMVWAHVADSKSKRMDNLYTKLIMRDRVPASTNIERDVQKVFAEESQLLDGSLMNLLQAYLTMVPDTQYSRGWFLHFTISRIWLTMTIGLTVIAGRLLLQAPEEDAFWTFVSMMDCQLRPYFSSNRSQLEVDAALFGKSVEAIEPELAKKIFSDMDIPSISLCRPWYVLLESLRNKISKSIKPGLLPSSSKRSHLNTPNVFGIFSYSKVTHVLFCLRLHRSLSSYRYNVSFSSWLGHRAVL
jgi:TBC1 domain family member 10